MGRTEEFNASLMLMLDEAVRASRQQAEVAVGHLRALVGASRDDDRVAAFVEAVVEASAQRALMTMLHRLEFEGSAIDDLSQEAESEPIENLIATQEVDYRTTIDLIIAEEERRLKGLQREADTLTKGLGTFGEGDATQKARLVELEEEQRRVRERIAQLVATRSPR